MSITFRLLGPADAVLLERADPDVFDGPVDAARIDEFLNDPRHHIAAAIDEQGVIRGFASGVVYVHPDKRAQLFVNEVGVVPAFQRQGVAMQVLSTLLDHGRSLGCVEAWVATEHDNLPARALYKKLGGREAPEAIVMYTFDFKDTEREQARP